MKKSVCFAFFLTIFPFCILGAQDKLPVPVKENSIYYEEIILVDSLLTKNDLLMLTKQWVTKNFVKTETYNPLQLEDKDYGMISVRIYLKDVGYRDEPVMVSCVGKIQVKDGKYRYTFSDFSYVSKSTNTNVGNNGKEEGSCDDFVKNWQNGNSKKRVGLYLERIDEQIQILIKSLKNTINDSTNINF
jgi:hypothetical protein